eukprot:GILJ01012377.1.p1 GENE.GILJ01012377.1~~GILJ01012377.1.p1  ORF type:complete len:679 (+),score=102.48 GILJ01012377.1:143-2038(+)
MAYGPFGGFESFLQAENKPIDYNLYADAQLVGKVRAAQNELKSFSSAQVGRVRDALNPYSTLGRGIFQSSMSIKMANLDHICHIIPTPSEQHGEYFFVDLLPEDGGALEYALWRCHQHRHAVRGWALANGSVDLALPRFHPDTNHARDLEVLTGSSMSLQDESIQSLIEIVNRATEDQGVHLVLAYGSKHSGESWHVRSERDMTSLLLGEVTVAMQLLAQHGTLVVRLYETASSFTVGLLYILYRHFEQISIVKPRSTSLDSPERFVVCKGFNQSKPPIASYLSELQDVAANLTKDRELGHCVREELLQEDRLFTDFIKEVNVELIREQDRFFDAVKAELQNPKGRHVDRNTVRHQAYDVWQVPEGLLAVPPPQSTQSSYHSRNNSIRPEDNPFEPDPYAAPTFEPYHQPPTSYLAPAHYAPYPSRPPGGVTKPKDESIDDPKKRHKSVYSSEWKKGAPTAPVVPAATSSSSSSNSTSGSSAAPAKPLKLAMRATAAADDLMAAYLGKSTTALRAAPSIALASTTITQTALTAKAGPTAAAKSGPPPSKRPKTMATKSESITVTPVAVAPALVAKPAASSAVSAPPPQGQFTDSASKKRPGKRKSSDAEVTEDKFVLNKQALAAINKYKAT